MTRSNDLTIDPDQAPGEVFVARLGDDVYWSQRYAFVIGCCETDRRDMPLRGRAMMMFIDFHTLVVRDGIDPQAAHREFLKIEEYRKRISPDIAEPPLRQRVR